MKPTLCIAAVLVSTLASAAAVAQPVPPAAPTPQAYVVTPDDVNELQRIVSEQIPPRWGQPIVMWWNGIEARSHKAAPPASAPQAKAPPAEVKK